MTTTRFGALFLVLLAQGARADEAPCAELAKVVVEMRDSPSDDRRVMCQFAKDTVAGGVPCSSPRSTIAC